MITLYTFGPAFGLPDPSPFVTKAEVLLKMAGVPYRTDTTGFKKAPKGKLPYIDDDGAIVADSTFIRMHLERSYGIDFDEGLSPAERGVAWAFEKMCEDHLYWAVVHARWMDRRQLRQRPAHVLRCSRRLPFGRSSSPWSGARFGATCGGTGMGRHTTAEIAQLAVRDLAAIADFLGDKPYLMGDGPCGADATVFAFVAAALRPRFKTPIRHGGRAAAPISSPIATA